MYIDINRPPRRKPVSQAEIPPRTKWEKEGTELIQQLSVRFIEHKEDRTSSEELVAEFVRKYDAESYKLQGNPQTIAEYQDEIEALHGMSIVLQNQNAIYSSITRIVNLRMKIEDEASGEQVQDANSSVEAPSESTRHFNSISEIDHEIDGYDPASEQNTRYYVEFHGDFADAKQTEMQEFVSKLPAETSKILEEANTPKAKKAYAITADLYALFREYRNIDPTQPNVIEIVKSKRQRYFELFTELQKVISTLESENPIKGDDDVPELKVNDPLSAEADLNGVKPVESQVEKDLRRASEREAKAQAFAEKFGITDERQRMLDAEAKYLEAQTALHAEAWTIGRKIPQEIQDEYDKSRLYWRQALGAATLLLPADDPEAKRDKVMAKFIGIRDTALRAEEVRIQAREVGLSEKDKTLFGKIRNSVVGFAGATARTYNKGFDIAGSALARTEQKVFGDTDFDLEKRGAQYARASRIIGGAVLGTLLTTGTAGLASMPLLFRVARGAVGVLGGSAAGAVAGSIYKKFFASKNQSELLASIKDLSTPIELSEMIAEQELYRKGNAKARAERQKKWETAAAILAGGATSLGSGYAIHHAFGELPSVKAAAVGLNEAQTVPAEGATGVNPEATLSESKAQLHSTVEEIRKIQEQNVQTSAPLERVQSGGPEVSPSIPSAGSVVPEAVATASTETISTPVTAEIHEGEGALKMFSDLKSNLRAQYPEGSDMPVNVKMILDNDPKVLAQSLGKFILPDGSSRIMHVGDSIKIDSHGNVLFADHNPKIAPVSLVSHAGRLEATEVGGRFETQPIRTVAETTPTPTPEPVAAAPTPAPVSVPPPAAAPVEASPETMTTAQLNAEHLAKINNSPINSSSSLPASGITLNAEDLPAINFGAVDIQPVPVTLDDLAGQPSVNESAIVDHVFKNSHGVEINIDKPALQAWKVPGTKLTLPVVYGGDDTARGAWAEKFLQNNPKFDYVLTTHTDPVTKNTFLQMHKLGANGLAMPPIGGVYIPGENINVGQNLPLPNVDDFIKMK